MLIRTTVHFFQLIFLSGHYILICWTLTRRICIDMKFKCYVTQRSGGWVGVCFPEKKCYEGVQLNVISVTWVGIKFLGKKVLHNT